MSETALVFRSSEGNKIVSINENSIAPDDNHFVVSLPDGIEHWRFSIDSDENLVIKFEGQDTATAIESLLAEQAATEAANNPSEE